VYQTNEPGVSQKEIQSKEGLFSTANGCFLNSISNIFFVSEGFERYRVIKIRTYANDFIW